MKPFQKLVQLRGKEAQYTEKVQKLFQAQAKMGHQCLILSQTFLFKIDKVPTTFMRLFESHKSSRHLFGG